MSYLMPSDTVHTEIEISKSRFLTAAGCATTTDEAKAFLDNIRSEMPDANHHVYAYRVGFANSVVESMSDDGEPSGTSAPPILSILRGSEIGDIIVVVTRYFGGKKLGTGGLVRAYSEATRSALAILPTELKINKTALFVNLPYSLYEICKRIIIQAGGEIISEEFRESIAVEFILPSAKIEALTETLRDATSGQVSLHNRN